MRLIPLALIAATGAAPLAAQDVATVEEPASHVPFPVSIATPGTGARHLLTGTGLRTRTFLKVKVYAFGLYVDSAGAVATLAPRFAGKSHRELERNDAFYDAILERRFAMSLRLVMTRDVGADQMAEAFDGALRPRVVEAGMSMDMPGGEAALDTFRGFFNVDEMTKESELLFTCTPDGTLSTRIKGTASPDIASPALCWALFDVYLGDHPISGDGKRSAVANFPALLGGSR